MSAGKTTGRTNFKRLTLTLHTRHFSETRESQLDLEDGSQSQSIDASFTPALGFNSHPTYPHSTGSTNSDDERAFARPADKLARILGGLPDDRFDDCEPDVSYRQPTKFGKGSARIGGRFKLPPIVLNRLTGRSPEFQLPSATAKSKGLHRSATFSTGPTSSRTLGFGRDPSIEPFVHFVRAAVTHNGTEPPLPSVLPESVGRPLHGAVDQETASPFMTTDRRTVLGTTSSGEPNIIPPSPLRPTLTRRVTLGMTSVLPASVPKARAAKRVRPLWSNKSMADADWMRVQGELPADGRELMRRPMSERDRVLNVKRARKMAQVFGVEPPQVLFQHVDHHSPVEPNHRVFRRSNRDSGISVQSASSSNSVASFAKQAHRRSRSTSDVSMLLITTQRTTVPPPLTETVDPPVTPAVDCTNASADILTLYQGQLPEPQSPLPFSELDDESQSCIPYRRDPFHNGNYTHPVDQSIFRARRLRAAKLSRFFGVGLNDVSASLDLDCTDTSAEPMQSDTIVQAEVKPKNRILRLGPMEERVVDMDDVLGQLRQMKANS